jgi:hypothetical protein
MLHAHSVVQDAVLHTVNATTHWSHDTLCFKLAPLQRGQIEQPQVVEQRSETRRAAIQQQAIRYLCACMSESLRWLCAHDCCRWDPQQRVAVKSKYFTRMRLALRQNEAENRFASTANAGSS